MNDDVNNDPADVVPTDEEGNPLKVKRSDLKSEKRSDLDPDGLIEEDNDLKSQVTKLKEKLKTALEEKQKYLDGWQRDKAEFLNARKRDREAQAEFLKFAKEDIVTELLPVLQSFEMAMANKEAWEKVDKNWRIGVEYISNQLKTVLETHGLKDVNPIGLQFDPMRDEAQEFVPVENEEQNNKVMEVIQKGYELNGKQLRAPKVKVGEFKKADSE
ncbi:MAG TPA: nucleotide exchange factor GrpE [Candidatus Paceibacterota bacterium]